MSDLKITKDSFKLYRVVKIFIYLALVLYILAYLQFLIFLRYHDGANHYDTNRLLLKSIADKTTYLTGSLAHIFLLLGFLAFFLVEVLGSVWPIFDSLLMNSIFQYSIAAVPSFILILIIYLIVFHNFNEYKKNGRLFFLLLSLSVVYLPIIAYLVWILYKLIFL